MKAAHKIGLLAALTCLAGLAVSTTARADDAVPSFKTSTDRETREFVTRVGTAIVKAARSRPEKIELDRYEYSKPKTGRRELLIKMTYTGPVSKRLGKKYTTTIKVKIDAADRDKWEVLDIEYKDSNRFSLLSPSEKKIRALIPKFNR
jgi:hypothetical protein